MSAHCSTVSSVVKIDVEAVGAMLDEMLAVPRRSPFEDLEPDYEFLNAVTHSDSYSSCR
jgi:hypothetical protein